MRYGVSYGNGNDGVSRLYPSFVVEAPEGSAAEIARLAMLTRGDASRRWVRANMQEDHSFDPNNASVWLSDPPRSSGWCDANGAWRIVEVYSAEEYVSDGSEAPEYASIRDAFGKVKA